RGTSATARSHATPKTPRPIAAPTRRRTSQETPPPAPAPCAPRCPPPSRSRPDSPAASRPRIASSRCPPVYYRAFRTLAASGISSSLRSMEHPFIPPEKTDAVTRALQEAFGVSEFEDICKLLGGLTSCLVFRIVVRGKPYLLRIIMRPDDPTRHYTNMRAAADAGIAPRLRYASVPDKLAITDFVNAVPFSPSDALVRMPALLRTLHALSRFAPVPPQITPPCTLLLQKAPARDGSLPAFQPATPAPEDERVEALTRFEQIAATYPLNPANMVSSHNDLKPENILSDGDRAWL